MADPDQSSAEYISLPDAYIAWIPLSSENPYALDKVVEVPMYFNANREKVLTNIFMENEGQTDKRLLSGVAVFLSVYN